MNRLSHPISAATISRHRENGFSIIELMVAILIGLFIVLGLSQMFLSMYSTAASQRSFATFQDSQRLALTVLQNNVALAGYYPNTSTAGAANTALPATTNADKSVFVAGTGVVGTTAKTNGTTSDTINIQYQSGGNTVDDIINCQGGAAAAATTPVTFINSFSVSGGNLQCTVTTGTGTPNTPLVIANNVSSMTILYGVISSGATSIGSYLTADQINTAGAVWGSVASVQITLVLTNPVSNTNSTWIQTINLVH